MRRLLNNFKGRGWNLAALAFFLGAVAAENVAKFWVSSAVLAMAHRARRRAHADLVARPAFVDIYFRRAAIGHWIGFVLAATGAVCWVASRMKHEKATQAPLLVLLAMYVLALLIFV